MNMASNRVFEAIARDAIEMFGGSDYGIFNTLSFQAVIQSIAGVFPDTKTVTYTLEKSPIIIRLRDGCHWMLIPGGHEKYTLD
jgi:hypothetical protein